MRVMQLLAFAGVAFLAQRAREAPSSPRGPELMALHAELLGDAPRTTGSAALAAAQDRVAAALRDAGCAPTVDEGESCVGRRCAVVRNLWCRMGPADGAPVIGLSHLDSVDGSPGAADGGAGVVAWVDAVRRLDVTILRRPLWIVITDGEELGLLGAERFFADHRPAGAQVVNLEARGSHGASLLFEVVGAPQALVPPPGARPNGSSAYAAVHERLPNDTDLSVVRRAGLAGVNHAFIGGVQHYHSPQDDRAHLDPRSLAHHADLALAWIEALQTPPAAGAWVFTDVLGLFVLRAPAATMWLVLALGLLGFGLRVRATGAPRPRVVLAAVAGLAGATLGAEALGAAIGAVAGPVWWDRPWIVRLASDAVVVAALVFAARVGTAHERWSAGVGLFAAVGLVATALDVRLSIVFLPALALSVAVPSAAGPLIGAAVLPYALGLGDALTLAHPGPIAAVTYLAGVGLLAPPAPIIPRPPPLSAPPAPPRAAPGALRRATASAPRR